MSKKLSEKDDLDVIAHDSTALERQIMHQAGKAVNESIVKSLTSYNGALQKLVENTVAMHAGQLSELINETFVGLIDSSEFNDQLGKALNKKLASVLVARMGGELEKQVNLLKQNPTTRAKITLAIQSVIDEQVSGDKTK